MQTATGDAMSRGSKHSPSDHQRVRYSLIHLRRKRQQKASFIGIEHERRRKLTRLFKVQRRKYIVVSVIYQLVLLIFFGAFVDYSPTHYNNESPVVVAPTQHNVTPSERGVFPGESHEDTETSTPDAGVDDPESESRTNGSRDTAPPLFNSMQLFLNKIEQERSSIDHLLRNREQHQHLLLENLLRIQASRNERMFQDVHVMVFVGVGFLMTFLRKYGYSAVGFNFLISAFSLQWATLCRGFFEMEHGRISVGITSMLGADFATVAVIISLGAVVGKTTPLQLLLMTIVEIALFATNEWFGIHILQAVDAGGSMYVHVFGAYFGLMVSLALRRQDNPDYSKEGAEYHSDVFAMIGTLFLWVFWPSFNAALVHGDNQYRAVINTYFSLAACVVTAFAVSSLVAKDNKFNMVHIQNSTLAGGVAVGTAADMMLYPYGALAVGIVAGTLSVVGYRFIQPALHSTLKIHDTCGVHNLHGMPGVLAGLIGALMAGLATEKEYGESLYLQFPARAPLNNTSALSDVNEVLMFLEPGENRSAAQQAGYQLLALFVTLVVAIVGGLITGFVLSLQWIGRVPRDKLFDDTHFWEVPEMEVGPGVVVSSAASTTSESHTNPIYNPRKDDADSKC